MTPDLRLLSGFARGVSLSLSVRVTCLHSGSWLLSIFLPVCSVQNPLLDCYNAGGGGGGDPSLKVFACKNFEKTRLL